MNAEQRIKLINDIADIQISSLEALLSSLDHSIGLMHGHIQTFKAIVESQQLSGYRAVSSVKKQEEFLKKVENIAAQFDTNPDDFLSNGEWKEHLARHINKVNTLNKKSEKMTDLFNQKIADARKTQGTMKKYLQNNKKDVKSNK